MADAAVVELARLGSRTGVADVPEALRIHKDETIDEVKELRPKDEKGRKTMGLHVYDPRHVALAGYNPELTYPAASFAVPVVLDGDNEVVHPPGTVIMFDEHGPIGTLTKEQFQRYTTPA